MFPLLILHYGLMNPHFGEYIFSSTINFTYDVTIAVEKIQLLRMEYMRNTVLFPCEPTANICIKAMAC